VVETADALSVPESAPSVRTPAVLKVATKEPAPFVSALAAGRIACGSLAEKLTSPANPVATFPNWSEAVTVNPAGTPATVLAESPPIASELARPGVAVTLNEVLSVAALAVKV
jgi:hypothetical protein